MILLVDAGNSFIKWRTQEQGHVLAAGKVACTSCSDLVNVWHELSPHAAWICSVAGNDVNRDIELALHALVSKVHWLHARKEGHGIVSHYQPPESLGADRFAALVAAHRRQPGALVVVSVGTALTADMLTAEGHFLGGCIVPGPWLMQNALDMGTAGIRKGRLATSREWPRSTATAVAQGIGLALWGVVAEMIRRLQGSVGEPPTVLLTGGARRVLMPFVNAEVVEVDQLVLEGLAWIALDSGYDA